MSKPASPGEAAAPRISRETPGSPGWREMVALRTQVLRAPLALSYSDAQLASEADQLHLALWLGPLLAGTLLVVPPDVAGDGKLRQMAIRPGLQHGGLGTLLVRRGEDELRRRQATGVRLSARVTAIGFYQRLGYVAEGEPFLEVTLPHRLMRRRLDG